MERIWHAWADFCVAVVLFFIKAWKAIPPVANWPILRRLKYFREWREFLEVRGLVGEIKPLDLEYDLWADGGVKLSPERVQELEAVLKVKKEQLGVLTKKYKINDIRTYGMPNKRSPAAGRKYDVAAAKLREEQRLAALNKPNSPEVNAPHRYLDPRIGERYAAQPYAQPLETPTAQGIAADIAAELKTEPEDIWGGGREMRVLDLAQAYDKPTIGVHERPHGPDSIEVPTLRADQFPAKKPTTVDRQAVARCIYLPLPATSDLPTLVPEGAAADIPVTVGETPQAAAPPPPRPDGPSPNEGAAVAKLRLVRGRSK